VGFEADGRRFASPPGEVTNVTQSDFYGQQTSLASYYFKLKRLSRLFEVGDEVRRTGIVVAKGRGGERETHSTSPPFFTARTTVRIRIGIKKEGKMYVYEFTDLRI